MVMVNSFDINELPQMSFDVESELVSADKSLSAERAHIVQAVQFECLTPDIGLAFAMFNFWVGMKKCSE
jgi:hypothetical protein